MDEIARLIEHFLSRGKHNQSLWKLDVLMDLGDIHDPRVMQFMAAVVVDTAEPPDVRVDALRRLRDRALSPDERTLAADAGLCAVGPGAASTLRLHAAVILGDFVDVRGVLDALGALAMDPREPIELRYDAFTSLQAAGPTTACLGVVRSLADDDLLGQSARSLLRSWGSG
jgi:hypothetical protein